MDDVVISLLAPVARQAIDGWVEEQVARLRVEAQPRGVQLGRLVRSRPSQGGDWLVHVDLEPRDVPPQEHLALACVLTDMERLGLRPALFLISARPRMSTPATHSPRLPLVAARCTPRARRSPPI